MKKIILSSLLASLTFSCTSSKHQMASSRFHDDGRAKAIVTLTPVYDPQEIKLPWSLSEDLTEIIKNRLLKKSNVFVADSYSDFSITAPIEKESVGFLNPQDENKSLNVHFANLKVKFPKTEFVVFLELAEHNVHPKQEQSGFFEKLSPSHQLDLCMRIRIYDLRGETPVIILQEMVEQNHLVPKQFAKLEYDSAIWGKKTYSISPMGFAHSQFAKEIASRIENYLILAKTK